MKGWVGLGGWLRNETVYLPEGSHHPSTTNRARCRATALIETNALPLHQTANHVTERVTAQQSQSWSVAENGHHSGRRHCRNEDRTRKWSSDAMRYTTSSMNTRLAYLTFRINSVPDHTAWQSIRLSSSMTLTLLFGCSTNTRISHCVMFFVRHINGHLFTFPC